MIDEQRVKANELPMVVRSMQLSTMMRISSIFGNIFNHMRYSKLHSINV